MPEARNFSAFCPSESESSETSAEVVEIEVRKCIAHRYQCLVVSSLFVQEEPDDAAKIAYVKQVIKTDYSHEFEKEAQLPSDLLDAIAWMGKRTPFQVMQERENIMRSIEAKAAQIKQSMVWSQWQASIRDEKIRALVKGVNGPMMRLLAKKAQYHDAACVDLFRDGAPLVGKIARTGSYTPKEKLAEISVAQLKEDRKSKNERLIQSIRQDTQWAEVLLQACKDDVNKGRMEAIRLEHEADLSRITLSPRFAIVQGAPLALEHVCSVCSRLHWLLACQESKIMVNPKCVR